MHERNDKQQLRLQLRQRRNSLTGAQRRSASENLVARLEAIPGWSTCRHVAGYIAADAEIDPAPLLEHLRQTGRTTYLPLIQADNSLLFAPWQPGDSLQANRFGIPEPRPENRAVSAGALDAVLLPLVGWDAAGTRLGMGGGFYDRSLAGADTLKIGLGYAAQEMDWLPRQRWDVSLDFVATELALHTCRA